MTDHSDNRETATERLARAEREMRQKNEANAEKSHESKHASHRDDIAKHDANPPRTTTGRVTSPKFGSATSGGGEIEPGPERD